jgi:ribose/xylose/arabinose/galactoside ABC-type transport system permease subunit
MADDLTAGMPPRPAPKTARGLDRAVLRRLRSYGLVIAIAAIVAFFQFQNSVFLSPDNLLVLIRSMASLAIISFAQLLVIISGELDLSVGAVYGLAATTLAVFWLGGGNAPFQLPFVIALALAIGVGVVTGAINAFFTTVVRIPSFIATLGMLSIAQGSELLLSNASNFNPQYNVPPPTPGDLAFFRALGATQLPFGIPIQVVWLGAFFGLFWLIRHRTLFGFRLLAVGGNADAARVARLPVKKYKWIVFILCGVMAAVAGLLDFSYIGSVGPNSGGALTFPVFAAVVIGGASLNGGRGTVVGTLLGAILLTVLRNGLAIMGVGAFAGLIFVGVVTIGAVALDRVALGGRPQ